MKTKLNNLTFFILLVLMPIQLMSSNMSPIITYLLSDSEIDNSSILHEDISVTVFWIGEAAGEENGNIANIASAWDDMWMLNYGGVDTPNERNGYYPGSFIPNENPFYFALPYNDYDDNGIKKTDGHCAETNCKNRWIKIIKGENIAYAQWEDVGPSGEDDTAYVFATARPQNDINNNAGLDVSPAVRDYLNLSDIDVVSWQFIDEEDVPDGPWKAIVTTSGINWVDWYKPDVNTSWQWQLQPKVEGGTINTSYDVDMYDIDLFDSSKALIQSLHDDGRKVICYFSAGSSEEWRDDFKDFNKSVLGNDLDPKWEGEKWLDIRSQSIRPIMIARLDLAKDKGCDGVEPDNVDGYTNDTGFSLTFDEQLLYNKFIAVEARKRALSVGLKNDLNQIVELEVFFDFALNEECHEYNECHLMQPFIDVNKPVFNAEYEVSEENREVLCQDSIQRQFKTLILPWNLDDEFRYSCGD